MNNKEADAAAVFAMSSPDGSDFGSSPAGRALRQARADCAMAFFAPFEDSPSPNKQAQNTSSLGVAGSPRVCISTFEEDVTAEEIILQKIAAAVEEEAEGSCGSDGDLDSGGSDSDDYASSNQVSDDASPDRPAPRALTTKAAGGTRTPGVGRGSAGLTRQSSSASSASLSAASTTRASALTLVSESSGAGAVKGGALAVQRRLHDALGTTASRSASSTTRASALTLVSESSGAGAVKGGALADQRRLHDALGATAFCTFKCACPMRGVNESCLEEGFDRSFFRSLHHHTYGRSPMFHTLVEVKAAVHKAVWELRQPLPPPHQEGRRFSVPVWRLGGPAGTVVCKKAFITATGGKPFAHREALAMTIAGMDPTDAKAGKCASKAIKAVQNVPTPRAEWARSWWKQHLMWHDWLPNEMSIQYRGPTWNCVYQGFYLPIATAAKMVLKPKQWMRQRKPAVATLHSQFFPTVTDRKLTVVRSARHSKFPECTDCQKLRCEYKKLAANPKASEILVDAAWQRLTNHASQWQKDRETAIDLRHRYSVMTSRWRYSVDDKCGSFWQAMPVSFTGRDTKENAKDKYRFSVHANVVCGERGHKQFTIVPKNISTGANFGLTNLLMTIFTAVKTGNLRSDTDCFVRHTDGGPDNVSVVTHFIHWLLVYLGVFNKFLWFRFKAGHSHTEVADRLFSIIKRLFESDGAHRVNPIESFPELIVKLEAAFAPEAESCIFNWNFANWDLRQMMSEMNCVSSKLRGISSKMVYQYSYDESLWEHGCVLVQYKSNISWTGNARDAEWSPLARVEKTMNVDDGDDEPRAVECNVSKPKGVRFVSKPPDLRIVPRREPFDPKADKFGPDKQCQAILNRRSDDLSPASKSFWKCLSKYHSCIGDVAEQVPDMPHTIHTENHSFTFDGSPSPFVDVMRKLMLRFPRPLLPYDPFATAPAESWEDAHAQSAANATPCSASGTASGSSSLEQELRDPRRENTVVDLEMDEAERRQNMRELAEEEYAETTPTRVEEVILDELYLCELETAEHGLRLGLGMATKKGPLNEDNQPTWTVAWFKVKSKNGWKTKNIAFEEYKQRGKRLTDDLEIASFRLHIDENDLTKVGREKKDTEPKFSGGFTDKVLAFARSEKLDEHDTEDEMDVVEDGDVEDGDGDEGEDEVLEDNLAWGAPEDDLVDDDDEQEEELADDDEPSSEEEPAPKKSRKNKGKARAAAVPADSSDEGPAPKKSRKNKGNAPAAAVPAATSDKKVSACEPSSACLCQ